MGIGVFGALIGVLGGVVVAGVTAYAGGLSDIVATRFVDAMQAFPALLLALVLVSAFGSSIILVLVAIALIYVSSTGILRPSVLNLKERQYVEGARCAGAGPLRILIEHILPKLMPTILVLFSLAVGNAIVIEASLGFLGLEVPPNIASWGGMIQATSIQTLPRQPWTLFSALAITAAVYAFNLLGDALRGVLDPRLRTA